MALFDISNCRSVRFGPLLAVMLALAAVGFWFGPARGFLFAPAGTVPSLSAITLCIWLGWFWLGLFGFAVVLHPSRALLLLTGAPFVLVWPILWIARAPECSAIGCL